MELEINKIKVVIIKLAKLSKKRSFDLWLTDGDILISKELIGDVLVENALPKQLSQFLDLVERKKVKKGLASITFAVQDKYRVSEYIKDQFKIVKAAGGVVTKGTDILWIHRLGKWDLPKGKIEKKEDKKDAAVREVEEECNVKVKLLSKVCNTWHTYTLHKKRVLKKTYWYHMECLDDVNMSPQTDEGIDKVEWKTELESMRCLKDTYHTIKSVINNYQS